MGQKKKIEPIEKKFISARSDDTFSLLYDSQIRSEQFQKLKPATKLMYIYCRNQSRSKEGTKCLHAYCKDEKQYHYDYSYFVFPAKHMTFYGLQRQNGNKYLKELQEAGFIDLIEGNKQRQKVNVYRFSERWKNL